MIEAGVGIGVVPEQAARRYSQRLNIKIVRLSDEWSVRNLHICVRELERLPSFARDLVAMLLEDVPSTEVPKQ
jgi:DNA-binding transcriptional LysR family regulator